MEITKEMFINFLKENNFYESWMGGFKLDNEIWTEITLDEFLKITKPSSWLYDGTSSMSMLSMRPEDPELRERYDKWRKDNLYQYMKLDEDWINFVNSNKDN